MEIIKIIDSIAVASTSINIINIEYEKLIPHKNSGKKILWWRRRESNSCPKPYSQELLRVQFMFYISLIITPMNRLYNSVAS